MNAAPPVMLFDGVCNLCNASVNFVLDRDRDARLRFASLQSESARELLTARGVAAPEGDPDSMVLIEGDRVWVRSDAVLRVCRHLPWPWRAASVFLIVPRGLRDAVYRLIARNRYRWFGRSEVCRMPTPALRARFLP
jgi:predicted DCC family thiol-disulfide oxidoreductase YuxK